MKLKYAGQFITGGTPSVDDPDMWSEPGTGTPWISIGDMSHGGRVDSCSRWISPAGIRDKRLTVAAPGTVLFAMYASVGATATLGVSATWNQAILGIQPLGERADGRFIGYWLQHVVPEVKALVRASTQDNLNAEQVANFPFSLISLGDQRRIADFLDDQVARIDNIIAARRSQLSLLDEAEASTAFDILAAREDPNRRATAMGWLPSVPSAWPMATVHAAYSVQLGKMLDESKFTGLHAIPYLRNTNVQWDRITTDDLKTIDIPPAERERFTVRAGDLLICEGGQPGRSAVWDGSIAVLGYQKALHRARSRNDNDVRWLQLVLRVAAHQNVFGVEFGQATIGHLTGEQLRALHLPMPAVSVQRARANAFASVQGNLHGLAAQLRRSIVKLNELKRSLITAAVTGEFDVSSADGSQVPVG